MDWVGELSLFGTTSFAPSGDFGGTRVFFIELAGTCAAPVSVAGGAMSRRVGLELDSLESLETEDTLDFEALVPSMGFLSRGRSSWASVGNVSCGLVDSLDENFRLK